MYKIVLYVLLIGFFMVLFGLQADEELAMHTLFEAKHGLNRAAHAAALQVDEDKLTKGIPSIDPDAAWTAASRYLQENLHLNSANEPLPGTFLREQVEVSVFEVINENHVFPYVYESPGFGYTVTLNRPGVVIIAKVHFPRTYSVLGPITWEIKSSSELVY